MKTALGLPVVGDWWGEGIEDFAGLHTEMCRRLEIQVPWNVLGDFTNDVLICKTHNTFPHHRARQMVVEQAIKEKCDVLFFVDQDMLLPQDSFKRLLRTMLEGQAAVVSGFYYRRGWDFTPVWYQNVVENPADGKPVARQLFATDGIHEIDSSGLGCALIDLHWLQANVPPPWFSNGKIDVAREVLDDVCFFRKVRENNGKVLGDANIRCGHFGERVVVCDRTWQMLRKLWIEMGADGVKPNEPLFPFSKIEPGAVSSSTA